VFFNSTSKKDHRQANSLRHFFSTPAYNYQERKSSQRLGTEELKMNHSKLTAPSAVKFVLLSLLAAACNGSGGGDSSGGPASTGATNCSPVTASAVAKSATESSSFLEEHATTGAMKKLVGHIPAKVKEMSDQGRLADDQEVPVTIALELNNEADLDQTLAGMYQPGSPNYQKYMTPAEFQAKYAPTDAQIEQTKALLASQGLTNLTVSANKLYIKATGSAATMNAAFHTELHQYKAEASEKAYFAPAYDLQVPTGSAIKAVVGLQNIAEAKPHAVKARADSPHTGSGPNGGYIPSEITTAYNIPSSLNGAGQTLAVFELDGYNASDITAYEAKFGLPNVPLQNVLVDGATGTAGGGANEVTLDIELMIAVAPGASKILVYEGPNDEQSILDVYGKIANDNLAQSVSTSWGSVETSLPVSTLQAESVVFKQMAAQGQTIYSAAGDNGADDNGSSLSVDDPSSQPYVVGVGGTKLTIASGGAYQSETTWNNGSSANGAGGGGVSTVWTIPSWQVGAATGKTLGSTTMRNVPDVSLNADPTTGYAIYYDGQWTVYGGTSCAAPLWAAFTALVNQQRIANGKGAIGFPNGLLYQLGSRYATDFHDINDGSTNLYYPAVTGYDDATGLGTIDGTNLLQDLSSDAAIPIGNPINSCS
jgi:kumamolisin